MGHSQKQRTLIGTKMCHKNPKKTYFCSAKMVPQEVVLFLTLEVVLFLTLEGLKSGTETIGSAKTDPVRFKLGFGEGLLKDKFALFEAYKSPIPKKRKTFHRLEATLA